MSVREFEKSQVSLASPGRTLPMAGYEILGNLQSRMGLLRNYMMSLDNGNLLQNHYFEAGLGGGGGHGGWESHTCQLRGHYLGHWLSGAAQYYAITHDAEVKIKADKIISELGVCQERNGDGWVFSIPEKYLDFISRGIGIWAPQYTVHKTLMGLWDMYHYAENEEALNILKKAADWFYRWGNSFSREKFDDILDWETGGMLEVWAELYGETGEQKHKALIDLYYRARLFDKLLRGEDALTNLHANTTIPEVLGAARAWEVTGEEKWRDIVFAYWKCAVTDRGYFATGGQTCGELWTPPYKLSARLGVRNQEHCTVYNMMRLAAVLFRWTGDPQYADYWERNYYNGILAQEHPHTGMVSYYLPMTPGRAKVWGHPTQDFWCCHGTLMQAIPMIHSHIYYDTDDGIIINQYIPSRLNAVKNGTNLTIEQGYCGTAKADDVGRPDNFRAIITVQSDDEIEMKLSLRVPLWLSAPMEVKVNGEGIKAEVNNEVITIEKIWKNDTVEIVFPKKITAIPMPDAPDMVAFADGPVVLGGLCDGEITLKVRRGENIENIFIAQDELDGGGWRAQYRTKWQDKNIEFLPLHLITDQKFALYFPFREE